MALIKCKECGNQVSDTAKNCPHCGANVPKPSGCGCLVAVMIGILVMFMIFGAQDKNRSAPGKPSEPREVVSNSGWDGSVYQVERYLKNTLKDPDSYQGIDWGAVAKTEQGWFIVRHKYRAKNGFGGYVVENRIFSLDAQGNVILAVPYGGQ